jgi:hypothetical protein
MKKLIIPFALVALLASVLAGDTLATLFSLDIRTDLKKVTGSAITRDSGSFRISQGFNDGNATDSLQANAVLNYSGTVSSAAAVIIDLNAATDPFGAAADLATVKVLALRNLDAANSITFGDGTGDSFAAGMATGTIITVPPMGAYVVTAPYAGFTVATPAYIIINCAGSAGYDLRIIGTK